MFIRKKKVKTILWGLTGTLLFLASAAVTCAYFTSTDLTVTNVFIPGTVRAELTETDWEEKSGEHMLPGETRQKNPAVRNTGTLEAWMFLEVEIPVRKIALVDQETRRKMPETETELFTFSTSQNWELLERSEEYNCVRYLYGCRELTAPLQETDCLFEHITSVPYLEGSLNDREELKIPVMAKAIQKNIAPEGTSLKKIYQIYLKQQEMERSTEE